MAIKIANLEQIADQFKQKQFAFKDLHLDFEKSGEYNTTLQRKIEGNDIKVDFDENAIRNSLKNLFNTRPGQRFLFPLYGLDLYFKCENFQKIGAFKIRGGMNASLQLTKEQLEKGVDVVGLIPEGLPFFQLPVIDLEKIKMQNLLDPAILFFLLGVLAGAIKSNLEILHQ